MPKFTIPAGAKFLPMPQVMPTGGNQQIANIDPGFWFSPLAPVKPMAPANQRPRQWGYQPGANLIWQPKGDEFLGFWILREFADSCDLFKLVLATVLDRLCAMKWEIRVIAQPGEPQKHLQQRQATDPRVAALRKFLLKPDGITPWSKWLRAWFEDVLVLDAGVIWKVRDLRGRIASLRYIDGATINRCIDEQGFTPMPPSVAYQQVLYGIPAFDFTTDELTYTMRNPRTWKRYGQGCVEQNLTHIGIALRRQQFVSDYYCYSEDTEVLTRNRGWQKFTDLCGTEELATRRITSGEFEWQAPTEPIFRKRFDGSMYHFKNRSLDLVVNENHRMLIDRTPRLLGLGKPQPKQEAVIEASALAAIKGSGIAIPQTSCWTGQEIQEREWHDDRGRVGGGEREGVHMTGDQYCAFMGMYLAEGWTGGNANPGRISIAQPKDGRGSWDLYRDLLRDIFGPTVYEQERGFEITRRALAQWLGDFGGAECKYIPEDIRESSPRQLEIFWRYYYAGDGAATGDDGGARQVFTVSRRLADHLTEIIQKMGSCQTTWTRPAGKARVGKRVITQNEGYLITRGYRKATCQWKAELVEYHGDVVCATVPNSFLYVRRNGKAAWCGNTSGNIPEAMCFLPSDLPIDRVKEIQDWFDSVLAGDLAKRRRLTFLPGYGSSNANTKPNVIFPKETLLKDPLDEWLFQMFCYNLGTTPQAMLRMMNRATAQQSAESSEEEGLEPKANDIAEVMNGIIQVDMGFDDCEFAWVQRREVDALKQMQIDTGYVNAGIKVRNESRVEQGLDAYPSPEMDKPMITTASGVVPVDAADNLQQMKDKAEATAPPESDDDEPPKGKKNPKPKPAKKVSGAATDSAASIDPSHATMVTREAQSRIEKVLQKVFRRQREKAVEDSKRLMKLRKDDDPKKTPDQIADELYAAIVSEFNASVPETSAALESATLEGVSRGILQIEISDAALIGEVNSVARDWAHERAAELVGRKYDDEGNLVDNPNAQWAISDTTRNELRQLVEDAFSEETPVSALADAIQTAGAFSDARATMIARTEVVRSQIQGNFAIWKASGLVKSVKWQIGDDDPCPLCEENDDEVRPLGDAFSNGWTMPQVHPNCSCVIYAVEFNE